MKCNPGLLCYYLSPITKRRAGRSIHALAFEFAVSKARPLIRTFGKKIGECNICGNIGKLTEDHSPPKSCVRPKAVQIRHIIGLLADQEIQERGRISQNGLKFRTLCHRCNNGLLGLRYDPALAQFTNRVSNVLNSSLRLPTVTYITGKPQFIMRAVFGHLAAQGVDRYSKGTETDDLRDAFLDTSIQFPENIRFYYWPFPHHGCVIFRDAAYLDIPTGNVAVIWLMKFFPISFMVAWEKTEAPMFRLPCLSDWRASNPDQEIEIPLMLTEIPHRYWPEAPSETSLITYGQEAMFTLPHLMVGEA